MELLEPDERERVKGFIINKFRGDLSLLQPGIEWLEQRTGKPVLGVVPYLHQMDIEAEDSVVLDQKPAASDKKEIDIAVIRLPRISNFTDIDPLQAEPDVQVRYVQRPEELGSPDAIILPGTKHTMGDLQFLREKGLDHAIASHYKAGGHVVGICGGYQMLGRTIYDPHGVESDLFEMTGLGYLPTETTFYAEKRTERVGGTVTCSHPGWEQWKGLPVHGYEIHMGKTLFLEPVDRLFTIGEHKDGSLSHDGRIWGTYLHGIFHNDAFRRNWLNQLRLQKGLNPIQELIPFRHRQMEAFDRLAEHVRQHVDVDQIVRITGLSTNKIRY